MPVISADEPKVTSNWTMYGLPKTDAYNALGSKQYLTHCRRENTLMITGREVLIYQLLAVIINDFSFLDLWIVVKHVKLKEEIGQS